MNTTNLIATYRKGIFTKTQLDLLRVHPMFVHEHEATMLFQGSKVDTEYTIKKELKRYLKKAEKSKELVKV